MVASPGTPMLVPVALQLRTPVVLMETIRLLPVSETQMFPSGATVTPHGTLNAFRGAFPVGLVTGAFQIPVPRFTLCIRLLRVSATHSVLPSGEMAIPEGWLSSPAGAVAPRPRLP